MQTFGLKDEYIKLGQLLKATGLVGSGVDAKFLIQDGKDGDQGPRGIEGLPGLPGNDGPMGYVRDIDFIDLFDELALSALSSFYVLSSSSMVWRMVLIGMRN